MALQGINLPLAFTGQEAIWQKVFQVILIFPLICRLLRLNIVCFYSSRVPKVEMLEKKN